MSWFSPFQESLSRRTLEAKGGGINHLSFFVDDIDKETAKLVEKGFKVIASGRYEAGGGFTYFDTDQVRDVIFALIQRPEEI